MYFVVAKLLFADDGKTSYDAKEMQALLEKIRQRFKISVKSYHADKGSQTADGILLAAVGQTSHQLEQLIDDIAEVCETTGFGRIEDEQVLIESFDQLEFDDEEIDDEG